MLVFMAGSLLGLGLELTVRDAIQALRNVRFVLLTIGMSMRLRFKPVRPVIARTTGMNLAVTAVELMNALTSAESPLPRL